MAEAQWRPTPEELYLFNNGQLLQSYTKFGAHPAAEKGVPGCGFTVWAPGAARVCVTGDFCNWAPDAWAMQQEGNTGIWTVFIPGVSEGALYKYVVSTPAGKCFFKADPYAFSAELRPGTASRITSLSGFEWSDDDWMTRRPPAEETARPLNVYELHAGSWRRPEDGREFYNYTELADQLIPYLTEMGYTHVELMPVTEHPFDGSWGYQTTGYFAATSRYGTPQQLMGFVNRCHQAGIGVILDWVPGHFCRDIHGLGQWGDEKVYEDADHRQWGTYTFNFSRSEVRGFLLSSAFFWLREFHADGLRVDGVTSMLYLNFGIEDEKEKRYNPDGTEENRDAVRFLQELNAMIGREFPGAITIAEESSAWPLVTYPPETGGLGFHYKWDMGWMNDTLSYFSKPWDQRREVHGKLTFSMMYAFSENYILPFSHDEVVHGKRSLIGRMPGDYREQFAGLRLLALYQLTHTGGKLTFMGNEFGQFIEWRYYESLEWFLLGYETHERHRKFVRALNGLYRELPALWEINRSWEGFEWIDANNSEQSVLSFVRRDKTGRQTVVVILNLRPETYEQYRIGLPEPGTYVERLNTDAAEWGGTDRVNGKKLRSEPIPAHGQAQSAELTLPGMSGLVLVRTGSLCPHKKEQSKAEAESSPSAL